MNYTKPELAVLGEAVRLIEMVGGKEQPPASDGSFLTTIPAYDLDE